MGASSGGGGGGMSGSGSGGNVSGGGGVSFGNVPNFLRPPPPPEERFGNQGQFSAQDVQQYVRGNMGDYGGMQRQMAQTGVSMADMPRALGVPQGSVYSYMNRPDYKMYGGNGQFYQPIYQPQYQNYSRAPFGGYYSPGYGAFGGYESPYGYGGGYGGGFPVDMPMMPFRARGAVQEGDDFIPRGPRSQMSPIQAFRSVFNRDGLQSGPAAPPPSAAPQGAITAQMPIFSASQLSGLLGGMPMKAEGGTINADDQPIDPDDGIASLLNK